MKNKDKPSTLNVEGIVAARDGQPYIKAIQGP
jgi:hypothetical protein